MCNCLYKKPECQAPRKEDCRLYWNERQGQISWRLDDQKAVVRSMKRDIAECHDNLSRIAAQEPSA